MILGYQNGRNLRRYLPRCLRRRIVIESCTSKPECATPPLWLRNARNFAVSIFIFEFLLLPPMGCGAAKATGLGFVCYVVINPRVSANRVDLGSCFMNFRFINPPPPSVSFKQGSAQHQPSSERRGSRQPSHVLHPLGCLDCPGMLSLKCHEAPGI